ncbi:hypothetical protein A3Q34_18950 [Colwellia sp. PAMC 20917]|uniref:hypothetical protein n=1 Tax=Colwellia sp. PAMC 20917 TaxID=1816218 RepID=UPI0008783AE2|nr:hypothetical protein [Colwellia sp. PAMC 20917]AOW78733.1 hypothetical protein A3Q34_18950 [Colwellia sp. PAMC 20917]
MKTLSFILLSFSLSCTAAEDFLNKYAVNIDGMLMSKLLPINEMDTLTHKFEPAITFNCGVSSRVYALDEQLKFKFENGQLRVVSSFFSTGNIISYTPLRALSGFAFRPALFKGYYFISE